MVSTIYKYLLAAGCRQKKGILITPYYRVPSLNINPPADAVRSLQVPLALDLPQAESFAHVQHQSGKSWLLAV
jgi:hypothetical protein